MFLVFKFIMSEFLYIKILLYVKYFFINKGFKYKLDENE